MLALMRWLALGLGAIVAVLLLAFVALLFGARFADGPLAMFPGGPLVSGTPVTEPVEDWSFATDEAEIELQLLAQDRSRIVWILVDGERAFIPCSLGFPPGKNWYRVAAEDGRALLRIDGRLYPVELERVHDEAQIGRLGRIAASKYPNLPPGDAGFWMFAIRWRDS